MDFTSVTRLAEVIGVNLILCGDNAVIVGLALHRLPPSRQRRASIIGITAAVVLQIAATLTVASLLRLPVISSLGGMVLIWIAFRMGPKKDEDRAVSDGHHRDDFPESILTLITAYLVMCLDNILAVAAVAREHPIFIVFGLLLSCGLLIPGSLFIAGVMKRYPLLVSAASALLGWVGGAMIAAPLAAFGHGLESTAAQIIIPSLIAVVVISASTWWSFCKQNVPLLRSLKWSIRDRDRLHGR